MPRERKTRSGTVQFLMRITPELDDRIRAAAEQAPAQLSPQQFAIMCIERAMADTQKYLRPTAKR